MSEVQFLTSWKGRNFSLDIFWPARFHILYLQ